MRSTLPAVSVVMAVRNAAATVDRAIASIRAQSLRSWEMVLVDDRSTDGGSAIMAALARADGRIRLIQAAEGGLVRSLNQGLALARSRWIARMDADDESHPDRLAAQVARLESGPDLGAVTCQVVFGGDRSRHAGYARHVDWLNSLTTPETIALNRFIESPVANPATTIAREWIERLGGYRDGPFPEDYDFWLRGLEAGLRIGSVPRALFTWNDSPNRLTRRDARYDPEAFFRLKTPFLARAIEAVRKDRQVWIWGAGRRTRRRVDPLIAAGVQVAGYVDIDPRKVAGRRLGVPVILPEALPGFEQAVVVGYVSKPGARDLIREHLSTRGGVEGRDFLMAA